MENEKKVCEQKVEKKVYQKPEADMIEFRYKDIVAASGGESPSSGDDGGEG